MVRATRAAAWLLTYAALVAGGVGTGRALALRDDAAGAATGAMVLAATGSNGNGNENGNGNGNGHGHPAFGITSTPVTGLVPGGPAQALTITLQNTDTVDYKVLSLQLDVDSPGGCSGPSNLVVAGLGRTSLLGAANRYDASVPGAPQLEIPKKGSLTLSGITVRMPNLATSQDACKSTVFTLSYSGTATQGSGGN